MKKKNILIIVIIIFLVIAAILMLLNKKDVDVDTKTEAEKEFVPDISSEEKQGQSEEKVADSIVVFKKQLENRARFFIERYNTYSSDNNQENLQSLLPQVSNRLAKEIETRLTKAIDQSDDFFAFQTKVLSLNLFDFIDNKKAIFNGQVQVQEIHNQQTEIHYKTATLEFIYENLEWKVDDIEIN